MHCTIRCVRFVYITGPVGEFNKFLHGGGGGGGGGVGLRPEVQPLTLFKRE